MDIRIYVAKCEVVAHAAGDVIFKRGDPGDLMYVVKDGEVSITYGEGTYGEGTYGEGTYGDGQSVTVGPGHSFGEMALIDGHSRSADVVAATDVELYPVNRSLFLVLVQDTPFFALEVMKSLTERLRRANTVS